MSLATIPLIGLKADNFRHPLDLEATNTIKQLPGIDLLVRQLLGPLGEQFFYMENIASSVLVGENQLPHLYKILLDACQTVDLEPPQLYVRQHPVPNAYTFAMRGKQPFIVVHTSLIELLSLEEIQAVLGHELGHLKCEHGVYLTLGNLIVLAAGQISTWGGIIAQSIQNQILEWVRCAEFTCDRAALLATQNPKVVASVLMKLAGGSPSISAQLNVDAFLAQARAYKEFSNTELGEVLRQLQTAQLTHPLPVLRAREIDRWSSSQKYQDILQNLTRSDYNSQSKGGWRNW
ncbi:MULTISPECIES: M48 family metallopeptidase [Okeania]|uniref:M48 family peptidase n=1 Tax=Okeania hirsuta TaxID=1458930 RepID=A0A3N6PK03_9CYAN|nr:MULTISPECIES: M48 family metallopeptidase [Okeania]NET14802.1 M48 family metallopeptidase [Okeania sp. SIO1H6]NES76104.1 M48 family metallopeptidase [Okeania sp. SIO1H4]NES91777.1 M48 family metallopeptidase [Okeania sp. SIO2B9]NET19417.1 M48 family metallopeptidase [Okeania sp. SIO1H5]NET76085.1 M48 family metallopeptidase [Okeania sp. SIO1F9]